MERITLTTLVNNKPTLSCIAISKESMSQAVKTALASGFKEITEGIYDNSMVLMGMNDKEQEVFMLYRWEVSSLPHKGQRKFPVNPNKIP